MEEKRLTEDEYAAMAARDPFVVARAPEGALTKKICLSALKRSGIALDFMPEEMLDMDMYRAAVVSSNGSALSSVPEGKRTAKLCRLALSLDGETLSDVPSRLRDRENCLLALRSCGRAVSFVPENVMDDELALTALKTTGRAYALLPRPYRTQEARRTAVSSDGTALELISERQRTENVCLAALMATPKAHISVPDNLRTEDFYVKAAILSKGVLRYIPEKFMTDRVIDAALAFHGASLKYVPLSRLTPGRAALAIENDGGAWTYVPRLMRSNELLISALTTEVNFSRDPALFMVRLSTSDRARISAEDLNALKKAKAFMDKNRERIAEWTEPLLDGRNPARSWIAIRGESGKIKVGEHGFVLDRTRPEEAFGIVPKGLVDDHVFARAVREGIRRKLERRLLAPLHRLIMRGAVSAAKKGEEN